MKIKQTIVLLRHATAMKNLQGIHGGKGTDLIEPATSEIYDIGNRLLQLPILFETIIHTPRQQCMQTAQLLSKLLNVKFIELQELEPISLGIVDGLSDQEVTNKYSEIGEKLAKWRNGEIEINQLEIPQMTDCRIFFDRGKKFIDDLISKKESTIIISSRSILVLLMNVLLGRNPEVGGNYREVKWENAKFVVFTISDIGKSFHLDVSTVQI